MNDTVSITTIYESIKEARQSKMRIDVYGDKRWYLDGKLHREDGPAVIFNGDVEEHWYKNGKLHRDGGPALTNVDGSYEWYKDGVPHREDGPATYCAHNNRYIWYRDGELHRLDGPAVISGDGRMSWYIDDKYYNTLLEWAIAALKYQGLPSDRKAANSYLQKVLSKLTDEEI